MAAEIDGQPGVDLVSANEAGENGPSFSFLLNRGKGSYFPEVRQVLNPLFILHTILAGDWNGDGFGDVAAAVDDATSFPVRTMVLVFPNDGAGSLLDADEYPLPGLFPQCLVAGDVNNDGITDLVVCHSAPGSGAGLVSVLLGHTTAGIADGTFVHSGDFTVGSSPTTALVTDVDGDHHSDLIVADSNERKVFILYGTGNATLFESPVLLGTIDSGSAIAVSTAGAHPSVLVSSYSASELLVFPQASPRTFGAPTFTPLGFPPSGMVFADFDGDHVPDALFVSLATSQISLWHGQGNDTFTFAESATVGDQPSSLAVADLNGDGKLDVATTSLTTDRVTVVLNGVDAPATPTSTPTITPTRPTATPTATATVTASGHAGTPTPMRTFPFGTPTPTRTPAGPGDADCSGHVDQADIDAVIARIFAPGCDAADANGDGEVTAADVSRVLRILTNGGI